MITRGCEPGFGEVLFDVQNGNSNKKMVGIVEKATLDNITEIIDFENSILRVLPNPHLFQGHDSETLKEELLAGDDIILVRHTERKNIMSMLVFTHPRDCEHNLALDSNLENEDIMKTAVVNVIAVHPDYRGMGIQRYLLKLADKLAKDCGAKFLAATVSPENVHSLKNLLNKGYEIKNEKLKYGGKNRYIMLKVLE